MTDTKQDEQYTLAQGMTDDYNRVLDLCAKINERNNGVSSWNEWPEMVERIIDEHIGDPLDISATLTNVPLSVLEGYESAKMTDYLHEIEVTLGTGGPARGINFSNGNAYCWHQDWGTPKVEDVRALDNADILASRWGLEDF